MPPSIASPNVRAHVQPELLRAPEVCAMVGICRATLYKWMAERPDFPKPIRLSPRAIRWRTIDVQMWIDSQQEAA